MSADSPIVNLIRIVAVACVLVLTGCSLPTLANRVPTSALRDTEATRLGEAISPAVSSHPKLSAVHALPSDKEAFAARGLLAAAAERSIDAQYYIWQADRTGNLLLEALWQAAERGVRVRLLLDDINTSGMDSRLATLAAHPNIEVRLFNPLINRRARWTNYLFDFGRINHRMHNKSFTVDNQVTIVGGRNVGDEYFDAGAAISYDDLDVLAIGDVVRAVSDEFDLFWNSAAAYPAGNLVGAPSAGSVERLLASFRATHADPEAMQYLAALRATPLVSQLVARQLEWEWVEARLVFDDPAKAVDPKHRESQLLLSRLLTTTASPERQFDLISPYFVPRGRGEAGLKSLAERGVQVRVLTNSLASTDVVEVHAGYAKHRKALLRAGAHLYELERKPKSESSAEHKAGAKSFSGLHAKTFQIDGKTVFVGSFNFDPRSARINTEMGVVLNSTALADRLVSFFDTEVPSLSFEVVLNDKDQLRWLQKTSGDARAYDREPQTSVWRRTEARLFSILPIEWLL